MIGDPMYRFHLNESSPCDRLPEESPGEHLWCVGGLWHVARPDAGRYLLDRENLLTLKGPGCYHCGYEWGPAVARRPCPGWTEES